MMISFRKMGAWLRDNFPTRESMEQNRFIRPFAHTVLRTELWRFTRRSVPRGVALGLFMAIAVPLPQAPFAALSAVPFRANVPLAIAMTWVSNPATWFIMFPCAISLSNGMGFHVDAHHVEVLMAKHASMAEWFAWVMSSAGPALLAGLFVLAILMASAGYLVSSFGWRWWIGHKRRGRNARVLQARDLA